MAVFLSSCSDLHKPETHQLLLPSDGGNASGLESLDYLAENYRKQAVVDRAGFEVDVVGPNYVRHRIPIKPSKDVKTALFCFDVVSASKTSAVGIRLDFENSRATFVADWKSQRAEARKNSAFDVDAFFTAKGVCGAVMLHDLDKLAEVAFYPAIGFNSEFPGFAGDAAGKATVSQYVIVALPK